MRGDQAEKGHEKEGGQKPEKGYSRQPPAQCASTLRQVCLAWIIAPIANHLDSHKWSSSSKALPCESISSAAESISIRRSDAPNYRQTSASRWNRDDNQHLIIVRNRDRMIVSTILSSVTGFHRRYSHDGRHVDLRVSRRTMTNFQPLSVALLRLISSVVANEDESTVCLERNRRNVVNY